MSVDEIMKVCSTMINSVKITFPKKKVKMKPAIIGSMGSWEDAHSVSQ